MSKLPPIPIGDRFADVSTFRHLGRGGPSQLFECWDDAIRAYTLAYGELVREECAKAAEAQLDPDNDSYHDYAVIQCAAAIRSKT